MGTLDGLALGTAERAEGRVYGALRRGRLTWPELSALAGRDDVMEALWRGTAELIGLPP